MDIHTINNNKATHDITWFFFFLLSNNVQNELAKNWPISKQIGKKLRQSYCDFLLLLLPEQLCSNLTE